MFKRFAKVVSFMMLISLVLLANSSFQTLATANDRGRKLYLQYCASCHGIDGMGNGPVTPNLKVAPPDLTAIEKNEGKFPSLRIQNVIAGEVGQTELTIHGTKEMPVWGNIFRLKKGQTHSILNVYALTKYIESIQKK
ncbi:MAG: c-type cytochrome [Acidobacteriota bacterium]